MNGFDDHDYDIVDDDVWPLGELDRAKIAQMFVDGHMDLRKYRELEEQGKPTANGHYLQAFLPNAKRRCGLVVCLKCRASMCICRLRYYAEEEIELSWATIVRTQDTLQSMDRDDVIAYFFDVQCICSSQDAREVRTLSQLYHENNFSMLSDRPVQDIAHCLSQAVIRSARIPKPLSQCENYRLPYERRNHQRVGGAASSSSASNH